MILIVLLVSAINAREMHSEQLTLNQLCSFAVLAEGRSLGRRVEIQNKYTLLSLTIANKKQLASNRIQPGDLLRPLHKDGSDKLPSLLTANVFRREGVGEGSDVSNCLNRASTLERSVAIESGSGMNATSCYISVGQKGGNIINHK